MKSRQTIENKLSNFKIRIERVKRSLPHKFNSREIRQVFDEINIIRSQIDLLEWVLRPEEEVCT